MNFSNIFYIFYLLNGLRTKKITEGKHFFLRNYSGLSWHLRERRYLLMTKKGPVEYVFNLKHYLACFAVFLFGLCSSLTILITFIINVIKEDLISPAIATPIVVADFIDPRALNKNYDFLNIRKKQSLKNIGFNRNVYVKKIRYGFYTKSFDINTNLKTYDPLNDMAFKYFKDTLNKYNNSQVTDPDFYEVSLNPKILSNSLESIEFAYSKKGFPKEFFVVKESKENNFSDLMSWFLPKYNDNIITFKDVNIGKDFDKYNKASINNNTDENIDDTYLPINPSKMPIEAEAYRLLASFDNEIIQFKNLLKSLSINIGNNINTRIENVLLNRNTVSPDSPLFFKLLTERVNLTKDLRLALNFIPLKAPMDYYYISSKYGYRKDPITKKKRFHPGIDLAGTWHEDVLAPADGTVFFAGNNGGYGKMVKIKHKYGIITTYGHLQKITVSKGQKVVIGDRIGKMGTTGRSTGQHLHYEIWVNKKHTDPFLFIKEGKGLLTRNILQVSTN